MLLESHTHLADVAVGLRRDGLERHALVLLNHGIRRVDAVTWDGMVFFGKREMEGRVVSDRESDVKMYRGGNNAE
jgi:hypothetical protein